MNNITYGDKLQYPRKGISMSQKDFADFLGILQPSLLAYEKNRNSPTVNVLINLARKCNISLDWLSSISSAKQNTISSLSGIAEVLYALVEDKEIKLDFTIIDYLPNNTENNNNKWYTSIAIYGNNPENELNADLCNIIGIVENDCMDLESYSISKEKAKNYYTLPLKQMKFPELPREDSIKKHKGFLNKV